MSYRWPPPCWIHRCRRVEKVHVTYRSFSSETLKISSHMAYWVHLRLHGVWCILFKYPHRNRLGAVRSGERGGHGTRPTREIARCGNKRRSVAMLITAEWAVVPFCWNHRLWCGGSWGLEIHWSSLCSVAMCPPWWLVRLHPQRSRVQWLLWTKKHTKQ